MIILMCFINCKDSSNKNYAITEDAIPKSIIDQLNHFNQENTEYNDSVYFFVNFGLDSRRKRFFIYNNHLDSITGKGLVTRGTCWGKTAPKGAKYSNVVGSNCSSLGKYKVGNSYNGQFGLAYKLYGLDSTNSNAFERFVVLHGHSCVPNEENGLPLCLSQGCPTVSHDFLNELGQIIDNSDRPILLYLFDEPSN